METSRAIFIYGVAIIAMILSNSGVEAKRVACYFASWSVYRPDVGSISIDDIPGDLCTHIIYSFAGINTNSWELKINDPGIDQAGYTKFTGLKQRYQGLTTLLAVGGGSERGFSSLVAVKSQRDTFINSIVAFMNNYGFDGVDIDWEYPADPDTGGNANDKANIVTFLQELRAAFNNQGQGWEITMAVSVAAYYVNLGYDVPALCGLVDAIHAMAYDMRGPWTGYADVQSPMYQRPIDQGGNQQLNINDALQMWMDKGCPANKLVLGIPTYGRTYTLSSGNTSPGASISGVGNAGPYTRSEGTLAYYEICLNNWPRQWDDTAKCPYAFQGNQWVGYDDPESVQIKADFANQKGFAGVMTWTIDSDDFGGACGTRYPLISIMSKSMNG